MLEKELKEVWKNSSQTERIKFEVTQLLNEFKIGMENREQIVRKRDRREIFGAIVTIFLFIIVATDFPFSIATLGIVIIILSQCYSIYKLRSNRKSKHTEELFISIHEQLLHQKQFMMNQEKLLNTVFYWMLLPMYTGYLVVVWGLWDAQAYDLSPIISFIFPENLEGKIIFTIIMASFTAYLTWMNKKAARVNWKPLIKQINTILEQLKKGE